jgi:hypothetical protein
MKTVIARTLLVTLCTATAVAAIEAQSSARPETVMLTLQPRQGAEDDLAKAIADHWSAAKRLDLVAPDPHITLRARDEGGRPYFVEIFTWRDAEIPDNAPGEITAIWDRMNALTETRAGRPGLDIKSVALVAR